MAKRFPEAIIEKAEGVLEALKAGVVSPSKHHNGRWLSLRVGYDYRLLKRVDSEVWMLMTHEEYNHKKR